MAQLSTKLPWELAQTKWASTLNPILAIPFLNGNLISNISLTASTPLVINHLLQRTPQGWFLIDNTANATVWRAAAMNNLTITLEASANTNISFWVF
jgi:hypothetical protein